VTLRHELRQALVEEGIRKIDRWTDRYTMATVAWSMEPVDPFYNANTLEDLREAERLVGLLAD
jgi:molybdopterin-guanine dinucleotide biosynthesis protein A